jgi:Zn-dependent metalloprotease
MRRIVVLAAVIATVAINAPGVSAQRRVFTTGTPAEIATARARGLAHVQARIHEWGIETPDSLVVTRADVDERSRAHTRVQQYFRGIPVFGGEAIVHLREDGEVEAVTDALVPSVAVNPRARLGAGAAIGRAVANHGCGDCLTAPPVANLMVLRQQGVDRLVYRVELRREDGTAQTSLPVTFVDANTGDIVWEYDNLQTGSGNSLYSGTVTIGSSRNASGTYYMENLTARTGTFDFRNGTSSVFRFSDADDLWNSTTQRAGVDAQFGAERFLDYLRTVHGRNGIDGAGGPNGYTAHDGVTRLLSSRVHYSSNYNNAFWNGQFMTYGDGDGVNFSPLVTLDIAGHEMMHGVTQFTAGLVYSGESGALNESWSDVFGAMTERRVRGESSLTWLIGEQAYTPGVAGDALRSMSNPHAASNSGFTADDDPDHYSERYTGTGDNGGVHINSGIANKAFYLLAVGGTHHRGGSMTGIGADQAARIWFVAMTSYMTSSTNFTGARTATLNAAAALHGAGSTQHTAVGSAWCLVGVGSCGAPPPPPPPPPGSSIVINGGFEGSQSPWVRSGSGALYTANGSAPHSGTGYIYFGTANSVSGQTYQQITIPNGASSAQLTFWLNVTTSETTTTTRYDRLFVEVRNTSGTLLQTMATFSNLNRGTTGTYVQRGSYNLLGYQGQTIRLQFRGTTDSVLPTTFRVDDVAVQ